MTRSAFAGPLLASLLLTAAACAPDNRSDGASARVTSTAGSGATSSSPGSASATSDPPIDVRAELARVQVDDGRRPGGYDRSLFPHWLDLDGDGCDTRQEALVASSEVPAGTDGCRVIEGHWISAYDGVVTTDPKSFDVDHVVPLANAWISGADGWTTDQRAHFANDVTNLWVVSASSNRAKSDQAPDTWRPPRREVWCEYARRWVGVKATWRLSVTTTERDALGQMFETCGSVASPAPAPVMTSTTTVLYPNCAAARAAGAAPMRRGEPGYLERLDGDGDGVACE
jgi:hypothetical protein